MRRYPKHKVPTNGTYNWSPGLVFCATCTIFRAGAVPGAPGARRGPQGAENRPKTRGRIHHFILPKVCRIGPIGALLAPYWRPYRSAQPRGTRPEPGAPGRGPGPIPEVPGTWPGSWPTQTLQLRSSRATPHIWVSSAVHWQIGILFFRFSADFRPNLAPKPL